MERTTRYGSFVPVTSIGIAPIFGPETQRAARPQTPAQVYCNPVPGAMSTTGEGGRSAVAGDDDLWRSTAASA